MAPPQKKKNKTATKSPPPPIPIPSLPEDLLVSCLARVSRLHYQALSLVSKSFRSLLSSPELYQTRSSLSLTESFLYVCIQFRPDPNPRWFTLCRKPNPTSVTNRKKKKKPIDHILAPISVPESPPAHWSGLVAYGSNLYNIGGPIADAPSSTVSILDCRSHTWREAPSMIVERSYPAANVIDGKIYVTGGSTKSWMEVFDPKLQTWELVPTPGAEICGSSIAKTAVVDGKVYFVGLENGLVYEPNKDKWEMMAPEMDLGWVWFSYCVVDNILCYYHSGDFKWYDATVRLWRDVTGLKGMPKIAGYACVKLTDYGGKMAVLWTKYSPSSGYEEKRICCAVIALEKRSSEEVWGKVEWFDEVLTVPKSCSIEYALSATL